MSDGAAEQTAGIVGGPSLLGFLPGETWAPRRIAVGLPGGLRAPVIEPRIGLIINPRSHANIAQPIPLDVVRARHPGLSCAAPTSTEDLLDALRLFAAEGIDLLVISGGDGTLRDVLSALPAVYPGAFPDIAILSAGNTNLAARVLGSPGSGGDALEKLIAAIGNGKARRVSCPVLAVSWPTQPDRAPVCGFLFGAAAFTEAKRIANGIIHRRGLHQGLAVGLTTATTMLRALFGRDTPLTRGTPMRIEIDDAPARDGQCFLLLATTLDSLMLGLWPFWGGGDGAIRWLNIDAPPRRLGAGLLAVLLRRPRAWMAESGYRSSRADALRIRMMEPFMLDGEAFDPGPDGDILLSVTRSVTVLSA